MDSQEFSPIQSVKSHAKTFERVVEHNHFGGPCEIEELWKRFRFLKSRTTALRSCLILPKYLIDRSAQLVDSNAG